MSVVISSTGIYTPEQSINNKELVESYNQYADSYNAVSYTHLTLPTTPYV